MCQVRHIRQFIVTGHDTSTTPDFLLDSIAGEASRLGVLCCCANSTFLLLCDIRKNVRVHLVLGDEYTVRFEGSKLRWLSPDERSTATLIHKALEKREEAIGHMPTESSPGVSIRRMGFETTLEEAANDAIMVELHEDDGPVVQVEPPEDPLSTLSDHHDFTDEEAELLATVADERVRLGPETLRAGHSITIVYNYLDMAGYLQY